MTRAWIILLLACCACQRVVGIEERTSEVSEACYNYCAHVDNACTKVDFLSYQSTEHCEAICAFLEPPESHTGLTLACLEEHQGELSEPSDCAVGPSTDSCGDRCHAYCKLYPKICGKLPAGSTEQECEQACSVLAQDTSLDAVEAFAGNDTLQCRLAHLSTAALEAIRGNEGPRRNHCAHAYADLSGDLCIDKSLDCDRYCTVVMSACGAAAKRPYESAKHCAAVCANIPAPTSPVDKNATSLNCRLNYAYTALANGASDLCTWAGPAGGGESGAGCGSACRGYCEQLSAACAAHGFDRYGSADPIAACTDECNRQGSNLDCRADNIARALLSTPDAKPDLCKNAFGQGACAQQGTNP